VRVLTVSEAMASAGVEALDVVKMDVEGAEVGILESASEWLRGVRVLLVEAHDGAAEHVTELLAGHGFAVRTLPPPSPAVLVARVVRDLGGFLRCERLRGRGVGSVVRGLPARLRGFATGRSRIVAEENAILLARRG
jgi:hypothetical protein